MPRCHREPTVNCGGLQRRTEVLLLVTASRPSRSTARRRVLLGRYVPRFRKSLELGPCFRPIVENRGVKIRPLGQTSVCASESS